MTDAEKTPTVIDGVTVEVLFEQCERLASRCRTSTTSFQYAGALDSSVRVIKALLAERGIEA